VDWSAFGLILLGGALSIAGGVIASVLAANREREARAEERRAQRRDARDAELRELSDLASDQLEARVRRAAPTHLSSTDPRDWAWKSIKTGLRMKALAARIGDEPLREAVTTYTMTLGDVFDPSTPDEPDAKALRLAYATLSDRIVELLSEDD
jgi:hypothetical protein